MRRVFIIAKSEFQTAVRARGFLVGIMLMPILFGGAVAWCADANAGLDVAAVVDRHVVRDPTGTIGRVLVEVGSVPGVVGERLGNAERAQPHH